MARCSRCDARPSFLPVLLIFPPRATHPRGAPGRAVLDLPLCGVHKEECTVERVVSDAGWKVIEDSLVSRGKVRPERDRTRLEFIALDSSEARAFMRSKGH